MRRAAIAALIIILSALASSRGAPAAPEGEPPAPAGAAAREAAASPIGRLHVGGGRYCTGVLVAPRAAVTAAHCLVDARTGRWVDVSRIHFLLGYDRGEYAMHLRAKEYRTGHPLPAGVVSLPDRDWAVITLDAEAPDAHVPLSSAGAGETGDGAFRLAGYGSPRKYVVTTSPDCRAFTLDGLIASRCPTSAGMSGAPLIERDSGRLIGIQVRIQRREDGDLLLAVPASSWGVGDRGG